MNRAGSVKKLNFSPDKNGNSKTKKVTLDPHSVEWRQVIQLGSQLDIFVSEEDVEGTDTVSDWIKGTVVEIKGNMLKVEFADLPANYDKWINKLSNEVA